MIAPRSSKRSFASPAAGACSWDKQVNSFYFSVFFFPSCGPFGLRLSFLCWKWKVGFDSFVRIGPGFFARTCFGGLELVAWLSKALIIFFGCAIRFCVGLKPSKCKTSASLNSNMHRATTFCWFLLVNRLLIDFFPGSWIATYLIRRRMKNYTSFQSKTWNTSGSIQSCVP